MYKSSTINPGLYSDKGEYFFNLFSGHLRRMYGAYSNMGSTRLNIYLHHGYAVHNDGSA